MTIEVLSWKHFVGFIIIRAVSLSNRGIYILCFIFVSWLSVTRSLISTLVFSSKRRIIFRNSRNIETWWILPIWIFFFHYRRSRTHEYILRKWKKPIRRVDNRDKKAFKIIQIVMNTTATLKWKFTGLAYSTALKQNGTINLREWRPSIKKNALRHRSLFYLLRIRAL